MDRAEPVLDPIAHEDAEFVAAVEAGRASLEAGRGVPYEAVRHWLLSWVADKQLPPA
jgi:predicted transcriptional regulator